MNWLMTGENHATVDTSGETYAMHCESYNYKHQHGPIDNKLKYISCGCLLNELSIDSPACLQKLELSAQLPIKSSPKLS